MSSVNKYIKLWVEYSENDFKTANLLLNNGKKMGFAYQAAVFHCHQAIEKMMKATLLAHKKEIPRVHNLVYLLAQIGLNVPIEIRDMVSDISPHYLPPRYPDLSFDPKFSFAYNEKNTTEIIMQTKRIILWLKNNMK